MTRVQFYQLVCFCITQRQKTHIRKNGFTRILQCHSDTVVTLIGHGQRL